MSLTSPSFDSRNVCAQSLNKKFVAIKIKTQKKTEKERKKEEGDDLEGAPQLKSGEEKPLGPSRRNETKKKNYRHGSSSNSSFLSLL